MNYSVIRYTVGYILLFEALFMILPGIVGLIFKETDVVFVFLGVLIAFIFGLLMIIKKPKSMRMHAREGFIIVALGWILLSVFGAMPFILGGYIPSFTDAVFETASGFTTTGASIVPNVEALPKCILFWRSFTHWLGGMGVLVFILALLPSVGADHMHLMRAESPGPSVDKFVPKVKRTALILYLIYFLMTMIEIIMLVCGEMGLFDAVCLSFGTAGTGGFGTRVDSISSYSSYSQIVITVFMFLFGVNFKFYYLVLCKKIKDAIKMEEVRIYFIIYAVAVGMITFSIMKDVGSFGESLKISAFQAASVMTTTGYATVDFNLWSSFPQIIMIMLMFIGACAGSTGGGMKVSRIILYIKQANRDVSTMLHSKKVTAIKMDNKSVEKDTLKTANAYLMIYFMIMAVSIIIVSLDGKDLISTVTAVIATFNNIGPGLGEVGPMGGFAGFSILSKWTMIFDMIAGRLELFPMLILFSRKSWSI